jgi:hypothetical protein
VAELVILSVPVHQVDSELPALDHSHKVVVGSEDNSRVLLEELEALLDLDPRHHLVAHRLLVAHGAE